ncbi:MAG TPA: hypothetical protein VGP36_08900 [Mycobacteriales bacterium]|nr:hypothetical protein [Mycobacteriales bacterium]
MRAALAALVLLAATGCATDVVVVGSAAGLPYCDLNADKTEGGTVALAQSVPSAQWLPCVRDVPVGWKFASYLPEDGRTTIGFSSDRDGPHALTVSLRPSCDLSGATEVPSEQPEMRRFEQVTRVSHGYGGRRHYTFTGGCITYDFDLRGDTRAEPVATISEALGFLSRAGVARQVHDSSDGRLELDRQEGTP